MSNNTAKKPTYASVLTEAIKACDGILTDEKLTILRKLLESLQKKNSTTSGKLTPAQKENEELKTAILDYLSDGIARTASVIAKECSLCAEKDISSQKINALLRQMRIDDKTITREEVKRVAYFKIADEG